MASACPEPIEASRRVADPAHVLDEEQVGWRRETLCSETLRGQDGEWVLDGWAGNK